MLTVQLLGPPRFFLEDREVVFPFRKVQALACLVFLEGRISRDRLAELLWGEKPDAAAGANLRNALHQLRKTLPDESVRVDRQWVLRGQDVRVDLERLERGELPHPEDPLHPLMDGLTLPETETFEEWLRQARQHWFQREREVLLAQALRLRETERIPQATSLLRTLHRLEPLDEPCARLLMECAAAAGDRGHLCTVYQTLTRDLAEQVGVEPEEETVRLYRKLLREKPPRKPSASFRPLWGREEECRRIREFLRRDPERTPRAVLLTGEPGVGKSLILQHLCRQDETREGLLFRGSAARLEDRYPLYPWDDLLRSLMAQMDLESLEFPSSSWAFLGASFPSLGVTYGGSSVQPTSSAALGPVLASLFSRLSENRRVFLLLEDLQWYDQASLDLLESFLLSRPGPVSLLLSVRAKAREEAEVMLRRLARRGILELLALPVLSFRKEEAEGFCRFLRPDLPFSPQDLDSIYRRTEGLPLFLSELLRDKGSRTLEASPGQDLEDLIEEHLAELKAPERAVLEILSVFSVRGEWDLLLPLSGLSPQELAGALEVLKNQSLLREHAEREGDLRFEFCHTLVREHVYRGLSGTRRRILHGEVARLLEGRMRQGRWDGLLCSRIIRHSQLGGAAEKEFRFSVLALKEHVALNYELFPLRSDEELRHSAASFANREQTEQRLREIRDLGHRLRQRGTPSSETETTCRIFTCIQGGYHLWWGNYRLGLELVRKTLDRADEAKDPAAQMECVRHLCYRAIQVEDGDLLLSLGERLVDLADRHGREPEKAMGIRFLGLAEMFRRNYEEAREHLRRSYDLFQLIAELDDRYTYQEVAATGFTADTYHREGDLDRALEGYEASLRTCREEGFFRGCGHFHSALAHVAFDRRDEEGMALHLDQALEILHRAESFRGDSVVYSLGALLWWRRGKPERALACLRKADTLCLPLEKRNWIALQHVVKGRLKREADPASPLGLFLDRGEEEYLERALSLYEELGLTFKKRRLEEGCGILF